MWRPPRRSTYAELEQVVRADEFGKYDNRRLMDRLADVIMSIVCI